MQVRVFWGLEVIENEEVFTNVKSILFIDDPSNISHSLTPADLKNGLNVLMLNRKAVRGILLGID